VVSESSQVECPLTFFAFLLTKRLKIHELTNLISIRTLPVTVVTFELLLTSTPSWTLNKDIAIRLVAFENKSIQKNVWDN
jgi:hypothetical protein